MGKAKKQSRVNQMKRRQMIQDVFKKGKKQREIAKKFDEKISKRQGSMKKKEKFREMKMERRKDTNMSREQVSDLDKRFNEMRAEKKI